MLRGYLGHVIIVLDEIDSLSNAPFSDQIFSQIRSTYFARSNFPEYERLTYVLSGVAEPSDLIKDKSISPFNIGHKIYLNDFSFGEFQLFLSKAGLAIGAESAERIYSWASGNPRMTWEICSVVEDLEQGGTFITPQDIDSIVTRLYLHSFDRPPVDHIRTIVETDREIRDALIELKTGSGNRISDSLRGRLYLAGITSSATSETGVEIKNRIVAESLSDDWLDDIQVKTRGIVKLAREAFSEHRYSDATAYYESYLRDASLDGQPADLLRLGLGYLYSQRAEEAVRWLETYQARVTEKERDECQFQLARAVHLLGDLRRAESLYRSVLGSTRSVPFHALAGAYLASSLIQTNVERNRQEALSLVLSLVKDNWGGEPEIAAARAVAAAVVAAIRRFDGDTEDALRIIEKALVAAPHAYEPRLVLQAAETVKIHDSRYLTYLKRLAEAFIQYMPKGEGEVFDPAGITDEYWLRALLLSLVGEQRNMFESMAQYAEAHGLSRRLSRHEVYREMWRYAMTTGQESAVSTVLLDVIDKFESVPAARGIWKEALITLTGIKRGEIETSYKLRFIDLVRSEIDNHAPITREVYASLSLILQHTLSVDNFSVAARVIALAKNMPIPASGTSTAPSLLLLANCFLYHRRIGDIAIAEAEARDLTSYLNDQGVLRNLSRIDAGEFEYFRIVVRKFLDDRARLEPSRNPYKGIGRNQYVVVRYGDGEPQKLKFKYAERDLALRKCALMSIVDESQ